MTAQLITCLCLSFILSGCSTLWHSIVSEEEEDIVTYSAEERKLDETFSSHLQLFNERKFEPAINAFNQFLKEHPISKYTVAANFYLGRSYENLRVWNLAIEKLRLVTVAPAATPKLVAESFYHLSFCYEATGERTKTIGSLLDALEKHRFLPEEVARAEAPARLAATYMRIGNEKEALKYYQQAKNGLLELRRKFSQKTPSWLAKTLFYMGVNNDFDIQNAHFESEIRSLKRAQTYLLESAELGDSIWSPRAAKQLKASYRALWNAVTGLPAFENNDHVLAKRLRQKRQWEMSHLILSALDDLKTKRLPKDSENFYVSQIFLYLNSYEKQVRSLLDHRPEGEGMTPKALEEEGLFRQGRTVD